MPDLRGKRFSAAPGQIWERGLTLNNITDPEDRAAAAKRVADKVRAKAQARPRSALPTPPRVDDSAPITKFLVHIARLVGPFYPRT